MQSPWRAEHLFLRTTMSASATPSSQERTRRGGDARPDAERRMEPPQNERLLMLKAPPVRAFCWLCSGVEIECDERGSWCGECGRLQDGGR